MTLPILIDFDGVIRLGNKPAPDSEKFLQFVLDNQIPSFIISNSTLRTGTEIIDFLNENQFPSKIPVMTAADATVYFVRENYKKVAVYCIDNIKKLFNEYLDYDTPEAVVIGDHGDKWNFRLMNDIFKKVYDGADIVAMHKNKFWYPNGKELSLDAGAFVKAIEYAAGKEAILIGKPSPIYFQSALKILGYHVPSDFLMIGDDIESDIQGAQQAGGKGLLIYSGKTTYPLSKDIKIKPDFDAQNLTEAIEVVKMLVDK